MAILQSPICDTPGKGAKRCTKNEFVLILAINWIWCTAMRCSESIEYLLQVRYLKLVYKYLMVARTVSSYRL